MTSWLFMHQLMRAIRSVTRFRSLAANIFAGVLGFFLCLNVLVLGLGLGRLISETVPDRSPIEVVNELLFYYFAAELILRMMMQKVPTNLIRHYLHLPVRRSQLAHSILIRSFVSVFTVVPFLLFLPIGFTIIYPEYSVFTVSGWLMALFAISAGLNTLAIYWKFQAVERTSRIFILPVIVIIVVFLDMVPLIPIKEGFAAVLNLVVINPWLGTCFWIFPTLIYLKAFHTLRERAYLDKTGLQTASAKLGELAKLRSFGPIGEILALEIRMILRNKRPRSMLLMGLAMPLFGILIYQIISEETDFYPIPPSSESMISDGREVIGTGDIEVTFRVISSNMPEGAHIYLAGDHPVLGKWKPNGIPLIETSDGTWQQTIHFEKGTELKYKVTLGSWKTQRVGPDGSVPEDFQLTISRAGTVEISADSWMIPRRDFIVEFNLIYLGIAMTGMIMFIYGQLILGWDSRYFDSLLSRRFNFNEYFRAQFLLLLVAAFLGYLICFPYVYFGTDILGINTAILFYNVGINSFIVLLLATTNRKRVSLEAGAFDFQGKGVGQFLMFLPIAIPPVLIVAAFRSSENPEYGYWALVFFGLGGLIFYRPLLRLVTLSFEKQRYRIASGFREV